jgi:flavorubredoxin
MQPRTLEDGILWLGAIDWDRRLFDQLLPIPDGTSYNCYLVVGRDQTALIDTVEPAFTEVLLRRLASLGQARIDWVVINHAEQDHSGALPAILQRFPEARVLCTPKCQGMLVDHLAIDAARVVPVEDGATVPLGGKTLRFIFFPWVHWPETMLTFVEESRLLFSGDLFGAHLATSHMATGADPRVVAAAKLYYGGIMMPYRGVIAKNLPKVLALSPATIGPSHGPAWKEPKTILDAYQEWLTAHPKNLVALPYVSMHDSTRHLVTHLSEALIARGVDVEVINMGTDDVAKLMVALVDAGTIIFGSPMVLAGAHPKMVYAAHLTSLFKPKARLISVVGSFGWGGKLAEQLLGLVEGLKLEVIPPVLVKGAPRPEHFQALDGLADAIAQKHRELNLL